MRVLVCGGRSFDDRAALFTALDMIHDETPISLIIHGAASGADTLANTWAAERNVERHAYPANWLTFGKKAGPMRNQLMIADGAPNLVVAFAGGRGTSDMVMRARAAHIQVFQP